MWQHYATFFSTVFLHCIAYDVVVFSTVKLKKVTVEDLAASTKVLAVGVKNFSLPNFGVYAQAYSDENSNSPVAPLMRIFPHQKVIAMENPVMVISSGNNTQKSTAGVTYAVKDSYDLLISDEDVRGYHAVFVSSQDAFEEELVRRKRVSSNIDFGDEPGSDEVSKASSLQRLAGSHYMPVVLPCPNQSQKRTCLLYMEAFDIILPNSRYLTVGSGSRNKYSSQPNYCKCSVSDNQDSASFTISVELGEKIEDIKKEFSLKSGTTLTFQLDFIRSRNGYWYLDGTTLKKSFKITGMGKEQDLIVNSGTATNRVNIGAVFDQNFACYQTDAAVFNVSSSSNPTHVGIAMRNFEVTLGIIGNKTRFGLNTSDCVGTFSAGTWMGIIIFVVFISILLFGYLMVQSIHTMDRFDDLKQKQIVINFKE